MKQNYNSLPRKGWMSMAASIALLLIGPFAQAQEGSQGNTTIFGGAQMTFFSNHNFVTGGGGAQPGVILTERAAGNFGVLNFAGDNLTSIGASDAGYVDGYVRKYGAGTFVFPAHLFSPSETMVLSASLRLRPTALSVPIFTQTPIRLLPATFLQGPIMPHSPPEAHSRPAAWAPMSMW
jgi:hypothetical protein